jgi:hypothetical protein
MINIVIYLFYCGGNVKGRAKIFFEFKKISLNLVNYIFFGGGVFEGYTRFQREGSSPFRGMS